MTNSKEDTYKNTLYEGALMDISKHHRYNMPSEFRQLINAEFKEIEINDIYRIVSVVEQKHINLYSLYFDDRDVSTFPGIEFVSFKVDVISDREDLKDKKLFGEIVITYHKDLDKWSRYLHLTEDPESIKDKNTEPVNMVTSILKVEITK